MAKYNSSIPEVLDNEMAPVFIENRHFRIFLVRIPGVSSELKRIWFTSSTSKLFNASATYEIAVSLDNGEYVSHRCHSSNSLTAKEMESIRQDVIERNTE